MPPAFNVPPAVIDRVSGRTDGIMFFDRERSAMFAHVAPHSASIRSSATHLIWFILLESIAIPRATRDWPYAEPPVPLTANPMLFEAQYRIAA